jgi:acyl-CoA synthetase
LPDAAPETFSADGLEWDSRSLWSQFDALADRDGAALAVVDPEGTHWTRDQLRARALALRGALQEQGTVPGDRVMIEARKNVVTMAAVLAISSLGAIACPYGNKLGEADLAALEARLGHRLRLAWKRPDKSIGEIDGLFLAPPPEGAEPSDDERDRHTALIGFTSGSTGVPKAVMHGPVAVNYAARACAHIAGLCPGEPILAIVPWDSAPGYTFTLHFSMALGHPLVIVDPWDPVAALDLAEKYRCAWAICVPTHLFMMVEAAREGAWSGTLALRALAVGGSSMTPELIVDAEKLLNIRALRMFGMSECMGHASTHPDDSLERRLHSDGRSFPGTEDLAFDADLRPLGPGERGQAGVRGPSLFLGYCKGLGDGGAQMAPGGYLLTGDEIIRDEQGYIKVVGRIKDQIIRGGFNIDPAEIEGLLLRMDAIREAAVVPVPHSKLGEQACAVCVVRQGMEAPSLDMLTRHLAEQGLSKKKWPEHMMVIEAMPVNANGKIDKKALSLRAGQNLAG